MATMTSGTPVKSGYYWNVKRWTLAHVSNDGERLRGAAGEKWVRMPLPLVIAAMPVLGGVFVVAFPFFGAAAIAVALARRLGGGVKEGAADLAANLAPGALPGEAHLTGKPGAEASGEPEEIESLEALKKEIDEKRKP